MTSQGNREPDVSPCDDWVYLMGRPQMADFLRFMRTLGERKQARDVPGFVSEWREANSLISKLEPANPDWPNLVDLPRLSGEAAELAESMLNDPLAQASFQGKVHHWRMVELDRLLVFQKAVNLAFTAKVEASVGRNPTQVDLVKVAAGEGIHRPPVSIRQTGTNYNFLCASECLNCLNVTMLDPAVLPLSERNGHAAAVLAIVVGFGTNFLKVVRVENKLFLCNGTHRAYALRNLGVTHVPCLITEILHDTDFELLGMRELRPTLEQFARMPRPPLFRDYFDDRLRKIVPLPRSHPMLQVKISTENFRIPMLP